MCDNTRPPSNPPKDDEEEEIQEIRTDFVTIVPDTVPKIQIREKRSLCPLKNGVFPELHDLIFQHFDAADTVISSEVNKDWFETIGKSPKCMKDVVLGLENWWKCENPKKMKKVMNTILKSPREYQNVLINCNDNEDVSKKSLKVIGRFAPFLVDLKFYNTDGDGLELKLALPKLEKLKFINNVESVDGALLESSTSLSELNLKHHYWADPKPVFECLKNNPKLKTLKLWDTGIVSLFPLFESGCFDFKLKQFATGAEGLISEATQDKFIQFLDSQKDHMEAIRFRSGIDGVNCRILNYVFKMPALETIQIDKLKRLDQLNLVVNQNVRHMRLPYELHKMDTLELFLRCVPKLKTLHVRRIFRELIEYVANNLLECHTIYYTNVDGCMACMTRYLDSEQPENKSIILVKRDWI